MYTSNLRRSTHSGNTQEPKYTPYGNSSIGAGRTTGYSSTLQNNGRQQLSGSSGILGAGLRSTDSYDKTNSRIGAPAYTAYGGTSKQRMASRGKPDSLGRRISGDPEETKTPGLAKNGSLGGGAAAASNQASYYVRPGQTRVAGSYGTFTNNVPTFSKPDEDRQTSRLHKDRDSKSPIYPDPGFTKITGVGKSTSMQHPAASNPVGFSQSAKTYPG